MKFPLVFRSKLEKALKGWGEAERDAGRLRAENAHLRADNRSTNDLLLGCRKELADTQAKLVKALKNDQRDKKGKYTKAK